MLTIQEFLILTQQDFVSGAIKTGDDLVKALTNITFDELPHHRRGALRTYRKLNKTKRLQAAAKAVWIAREVQTSDAVEIPAYFVF